MSHECIRYFQTREIDDCSGEGHNKCYGLGPMFMESYVASLDGTECYYDDWIKVQVNYCPYCGVKSSVMV